MTDHYDEMAARWIAEQTTWPPRSEAVAVLLRQAVAEKDAEIAALKDEVQNLSTVVATGIDDVAGAGLDDRDAEIERLRQDNAQLQFALEQSEIAFSKAVAVERAACAGVLRKFISPHMHPEEREALEAFAQAIETRNVAGRLLDGVEHLAVPNCNEVTR